MATVLEFKRLLRDEAGLEQAAELAIGTTGFKGDGDRMFIQLNGTGILLSHDDARAFLKAARRVEATLSKGTH